MVGITAFGAYVPFSRLSREAIAKAWGGSAAPGEKAVASHDEDSITMAVAAALECLGGSERGTVDGLYFATTTSPYKEKQAATLIAKVLDFRREIRTGDFADSLRCATTALQAGADAIKAGSAEQILIAAADCRMGAPRSDFEQYFGDGAAALMLGKDQVIASLENAHSIAEELTDVWRTDEDDFVRSWEDRFVVTHGYTEIMREAVTGLLRKCELQPKDIAKAILYGPEARAHLALARALGFDPKTQVQDTLFTTIGNCGAALPVMMLVAALEEAKPGDLLLVASYGDGADAFLFKVTDQITAFRDQGRRGLRRLIESKRMLSNYEKYVRFRGLMETKTEALQRQAATSSATVLWRDREKVLSLHGSKCRQCGLVTYPVQRVCYGCQSKDQFDAVRLYDQPGKVFTYSLDYLAGGIEPPTIQTVVESAVGQARIYCLMTDADPTQVKVEMPVEMTFRRIHEGGGFHNYFWKARPVR